MKRNTYAVVLFTTAVLQACNAVHLRNSNGTSTTHHIPTGPAALATRNPKANSSQKCSKSAPEPAAVEFHNGTRNQHSSSAGTTKLRVCNAVTTQRDGLIDVSFNGVKQTTQPLKQRKCAEFVVTITPMNKLQVNLLGQVTADWSSEKSAAEMMEMPVLFLVAHVFGSHEGTTFSVNEFHGDSNGLKTTQVAYMDVYRGAPDAKLRLSSDDGEFEMSGGTYMSVCAGKYAVSFTQDGQTIGKVKRPTKFKVDDQYVVLRLAPEKATQTVFGYPAETVIVYPNDYREWDDEEGDTKKKKKMSDYFKDRPQVGFG